ncbi:MAG: 4a-hydroxytetrahydrobiopterin dehydratase [Chloroflexi bacterium]|nr:4a-hydroxytetrahydrobiopterin dehydratase [Chloroflexota bacterium]
MENLIGQKCVACRSDAPQVTDAEIQMYHPQVPNWKIVERNGEKQLERMFKFKDFDDAIIFTNQVAKLAQEQDHHPKITTEWGSVTITWWTHKIKGLHRNDFIMAAKTDQVNSVG